MRNQGNVTNLFFLDLPYTLKLSSPPCSMSPLAHVLRVISHGDLMSNAIFLDQRLNVTVAEVSAIPCKDVSLYEINNSYRVKEKMPDRNTMHIPEF